MKTAEKIEDERLKIEKLYRSFLEAGSSPELARYRELESWEKSGVAAQKKRELDALVFKGSIEYNQVKELGSLKKNAGLVRYLRVENSADLKRLEAVQSSDKLKLFFDLKDYMDSGRFSREKAEIKSEKYPGSVEEKQMKELKKLKRDQALISYFQLHKSSELEKHQKFMESPVLHRFLELKNAPERNKEARKEYRSMKRNPEIRAYFRLEGSKKLKHYREMKGSHILDRYEELMAITSSKDYLKRVNFLKDSRKLEKSEAWQKMLKYRSLSKDGDIAFYHKFSKSKDYLSYLDIKDSFTLQRYNELLQLTSSAEFLKRKAFLEDRKKWEKCDEYQQLQQFHELKKHPKVGLFFKYEKSKLFDFCKNWQVSFSDHFEGSTPDWERWVPNSYWGDKLLGDNFSQVGDLQAYSGGRNTLVSHGRLQLQVRKEPVVAKQWRPTAGFVPVPCNYSSDTLSTCRSFWQEKGIFEAKIRFSPAKEVVSAFYLLGDKPAPQLNLLEMGPVNRLGILHRASNGKAFNTGVSLNGLKQNRSYIFSVEWEGSHFTWRINDKVVFEVNDHEVNFPVHINLTSCVIDEISGSKLPVSFEVSWVKCFRRR